MPYIKTPGTGNPPAPPILVNPDTASATLANLTEGGVYLYELNAFTKQTGIQIWLPTAGPDISHHWQEEINYFRNIWGPAYRSRLNLRTAVYAISPAYAQAVKEVIKLNDIRKLGPILDWTNEDGIAGTKTPCGLANIRPLNYSAGDRDRFTMFGVVIDFAKRNNMMYALVGREIGLTEIVLRNGPDIKDQINKLIGDANDIGTPDGPAALESYEAGFDLHDGITLQQVMVSRGLKMQELLSRTSKEWPSSETTTNRLTRKASEELNALISSNEN